MPYCVAESGFLPPKNLLRQKVIVGKGPAEQIFAHAVAVHFQRRVNGHGVAHEGKIAKGYPGFQRVDGNAAVGPQAPGAVGYLFGDMVKDGIYQQAYYHGPSAAASELTGRLAGNSTFEAAVEEGFQPYQGEAPLQFGQSKTYTVKELVPEGYEASYVTAGGHTIITNTRTKQPDTAEIVPPKTGDSFRLYTVIALLFLSLGALLTLAASRKSRS